MPADWEPFAAAAFAPALVWILWRGQTYAVDLLRWRLVQLVRWGGTRWLYAVVSWFGVFLHEVSHASVLLLSGHGVKRFRAGVEQGHVLPARMRKGPFSFLFFLVAALAPLFIPPLLVLAGLYLLQDSRVVPFLAAQPGLQGALDALRELALRLPSMLALAIGRLDLAHWKGLLLLALILLGMPASRPSHVKGSRFHGTQDEGDVAVLRARIRRNPLVFLLFLAVLYAAYFTTRWRPEPYWYAFGAVWAVALTGILLCLLGAVWWSLAALAGRTRAFLGWLGPAAFVAAQAGFRALLPPETYQGPEPFVAYNVGSLAAWAAVALALALLFPRRRPLA